MASLQGDTEDPSHLVTKSDTAVYRSEYNAQQCSLASLVVALPKLDGPRVRGNEDGAAQEGSQRSVENGGEQSLQQQHG